MIKIFEVAPDFVDHEHVLDWASGMVWCEVETIERDRMYPHVDYIETTSEGVGVWYAYGADYYIFTDETEN